MASTPLEFVTYPGKTLTLKLFALGGDTVLESAACTEKTNDKGTYTATITGAFTGIHKVIAQDASNNLAASYYVDLDDDTNVHRCFDWNESHAKLTKSDGSGGRIFTKEAIGTDVGLTQSRASNLDNADVPTSSRLADADYTAPDNAAISEIAADAAELNDSKVLGVVASQTSLDALENLSIAEVTAIFDSFGITLGRVENLDNLDVPVSTVQDPIGPGSTPTTLTITDRSGNPIENCQVWVTSDEAGNNVIAGTLVTNTLGQVSFMLDPGITVYRWAQKNSVNFINPVAFIP